MTEQESERSGGTLPGLKKSDLLSRQTDDGSFEFIVESEPSENYSYEAEVSGGLTNDSQLPVRPRDTKRVGLIAAAVLLVIVLIGVGVAFSKSGSDSTRSDSESSGQEVVSGFKPYGGGDPTARAEPAVKERTARTRRAPEPVQEPEEYFEPESEAFEEMPSKADSDQEKEWQIGESEPAREVLDDISGIPRRSLARDRVQLQNFNPRGMASERMRAISEESGKRPRELDRVTSRRIDRMKQDMQANESIDESREQEGLYDSEQPAYDEQAVQESDYEEEYYEEDEEELEEEIY